MACPERSGPPGCAGRSLPGDCNVLRSIDADSNLLAADAENGDRDVITNVYAFTDFAGEYQHGLLLDCFVGHLIQTVQRSVVRID